MTAIKEYVTRNLLASLATISQLDGYSEDAQAELVKVRGNIPKNRLATIRDEGDNPREGPLQKDDWDAGYTIILQAAVSDQSVAPDPDIEVARFVADVRKALMQDYTRGAWAVNTTIGADIVVGTDRDGFAARSLTITVWYRTAKDDPYSL